MDINPKELQIEALKERSKAVNKGIESLMYNPNKDVMDNIQDLTEKLHAVDRDIQNEINKLQEPESVEEEVDNE